MRNWARLFKSSRNSGAYALAQPGEIQQVALAAGERNLNFIAVDFSQVESKDMFFQAMAQVLHFPAYFGQN